MDKAVINRGRGTHSPGSSSRRYNRRYNTRGTRNKDIAKRRRQTVITSTLGHTKRLPGNRCMSCPICLIPIVR